MVMIVILTCNDVIAEPAKRIEIQFCHPGCRQAGGHTSKGLSGIQTSGDQIEEVLVLTNL